MRKIFLLLLPFLIFLLINLIVFRQFYFHNRVPFPANLLASYYEPFRSYPAPEYPSGPPNKPIGFDALRIFYPYRKLTVDSLLKGSFPLWNPYSFTGNTHLATYQTVVFHPLGFLFFLFSEINAWSVLVVLAPFFGMILMYLFLSSLKLNKKAAVFSSIGFGLSGFVIANMEELPFCIYSALFLPLVFYGIFRLNEKISLKAFLSLLSGLVFSVLSGWFQFTMYLYIFALVYALFLVLRNKNKKFFFLVCLAFLLSLGLSAVHLVPGFEALMNSSRINTDAGFLFDTYLLPLHHLIILVAPDFFGNPGAYNYFGKGFYFEQILFVSLPVLVFGLYGLIVSFQKKTDFRFFSASFIISILLGFSHPVSRWLLYDLHLPLLSSMLPSRIFFISAFCLCVLSSYGLKNYFSSPSRKKLIFSLLIPGIILLSGWVYTVGSMLYVHYQVNLSKMGLPFYRVPDTLGVSQRNLYLPAIFFLLFIAVLLLSRIKSLFKISYYFFLFLAVLSSLYFSDKYLYFSERKFVFPEVPVIKKLQSLSGTYRVWSFGPAYIERNFLVNYRLYSPEGYDSLSIGRYIQLLYASNVTGRDFSPKISRADAVLRSAQNTKEVLEDSKRLKLLSLLGVKYLVGANNPKSDNTLSRRILKPVWRDSKFIIYEYLNVYPRSFIADDYVVLKSDAKIIDFLFSPKTRLSKTLVLEAPLPLKKSSRKLVSSVRIVSYKPEEIILKGESNKNAILFLSDNYYPGWKAFIDGKETPVYRADYAFRAVAFPSGRHTVKFVYSPFSFTLGLTVTLLSLLLLFFCLIFFKFLHKPERP